MHTDGFLVNRLLLLVLVREVLTAMLEVTGVDGEVLTVATGEVIEGVEVEMVMLGSVEHTAEDGGKK